MTASISLANAGTEKKKRNIPRWLYPVIYHRRKIAVVGIIIALLMVGLVAFCDPDETQPYENAKNLGKVVMNMVDGIFGDGEVGKAQNILLLDYSTQTDADGNTTGVTVSVGRDTNENNITTATYALSALSGPLKTVNDIFVNLGSAMLVIFWGMGFINLMIQTQGQMVMEQMIRKFVLLIVGFVLVKYGMTIVFGFCSFGTEIIAHLSDTLAAQSSAYDLTTLKNTLYEDMNAADGKLLGAITNLIVSIGYILRLAIPYLFCLISGIMVLFVAWKRAIEIIITAVISPVMFADIADDRGGFLQTHAFRAMRQVFALCMSGLLIYMSLYICSVITGCVFSDGVLAGDAESILGSTGTLVVLGIVRLGLVGKSSELSRQMAGLA